MAMIIEHSQKISNYLAKAIGANTSEITVGEERYKSSYRMEIPFLHNGLEIASAQPKDGRIPKLTFQLPASDAGKPFAPYSVEHMGNFEPSEAVLTYHIDKHPESVEILKNLRAKRLPERKIYVGAQPIIGQMENGGWYGVVLYILGTPREPLCLPVDPQFVKYVPEAEEQPDQEHHCIHGESAPVNPFDPNPPDSEKLSIVKITLADNNPLDPGRKEYLEEILGQIPIPADGLELYSRSKAMRFSGIKLRTPHEPFVKLWIDDPLVEQNWENAINLAKNTEAMFKE